MRVRAEEMCVAVQLRGHCGHQHSACVLRMGSCCPVQGDKTALGVVTGMILRETAKLHNQCWDSVCMQIKD